MSDLESLRLLVRGAVGALERSRQRIHDPNLYPVPHGDTGTNLLLTMRGVAEALARSNADNRENLAREMSRAALLSARGNSGVILSQIIRGAADELAETSQIDTAAIARVLRSAADAAYQALREPVEGTMLTVIRELADEAEAEASSALDPADLLEALVPRGDQAVAQTQEQLDVLQRAGVVDAGAAGLVEILRGVAAAARGEELPEPSRAPALPQQAVHQELSRFRYCTAFVIEGESLDPAHVERELDKLGDSLLVVGDSTALKAHVHTDDPETGLAALVAFNSERSAEENAEEMRRAVEGVATGEVTTASRDAEIDGLTVEKGDYLGLLDDRAMAAGPSFTEVARAVADALLAEPRDVLTLLAGDGAPGLNGLVDELGARYPALEIDLHEGGQPHYQLLLSAE